MSRLPFYDAAERLDVELGDDVASFADRYPPPDDAVSADRLLRARRRMIAEIEANELRAAALRDDIDRWLDATNGPLSDRLAYLDGALREWCEANGSTGLSSPFGRIRSRVGSWSVQLAADARDADVIAALRYAGLDHLVRVVESVDKAETRKALRPVDELDGEKPGHTAAVNPDTGEIVPGIVLVRGGRSWTITHDGDDR